MLQGVENETGSCVCPWNGERYQMLLQIGQRQATDIALGRLMQCSEGRGCNNSCIRIVLISTSRKY